MKYLVFTCKHHDGFCNFDTQLTDYKITSRRSPYGRDIVRQVADACQCLFRMEEALSGKSRMPAAAAESTGACTTRNPTGTIPTIATARRTRSTSNTCTGRCASC